MSFVFPGWEEACRLTAEAFDDPQPGDRFHEMVSFWMYVLAVDDDGRVHTLCASPPCNVPDDGRIEVFDNAEDYRAFWAYGSIPGYTVSLADRGNKVTGWREHLEAAGRVDDGSAKLRERREFYANLGKPKSVCGECGHERSGKR